MPPLALNTLIERYLAADKEVRDMEAKLRKLKQKLNDAEVKVMQAMEKQKLEVAGRKGARVRKDEVTSYNIKDYPKFAAFCKRNGLQFFQNRVAKRAVEEWRETHPNKLPPGVGEYTRPSLRIVRA